MNKKRRYYLLIHTNISDINYIRLLNDVLYLRRQIIRIGIPKPVQEVIESADTGRITKGKAAKDCIKQIYFQLGSPISKGMDFKINGK